jgi:16S rRNA (guanine527-N7)-methyltransferase
MATSLGALFSSLSEEKLQQLEQLPELYKEWNARINVISRKDIDQLMVRHVLHSLAIFKFLPFVDGTRVLDIGTGGGFPGIPLAIAQPGVQFTLIDSIGKKTKVVEEVARALGLQNVTVLHERAEKVSGKFDFVVSRAVAELETLLLWSHQKYVLKSMNALPNGLICLKGGDLREEMAKVKKHKELHELSSFFDEPFFETKKLVYVPN